MEINLTIGQLIDTLSAMVQRDVKVAQFSTKGDGKIKLTLSDDEWEPIYIDTLLDIYYY